MKAVRLLSVDERDERAGRGSRMVGKTTKKKNREERVTIKEKRTKERKELSVQTPKREKRLKEWHSFFPLLSSSFCLAWVKRKKLLDS